MADTGDGSRSAYIHQRKGRYMAQLLETFELEIEPLIPQEQAKNFKAAVRRKMTALAVDAIDLMELEKTAVNAAATDIRDRLFADGAAQPTGGGA